MRGVGGFGEWKGESCDVLGGLAFTMRDEDYGYRRHNPRVQNDKCNDDGEYGEKLTLSPRRLVDIHTEDEEAELATLKVYRTRRRGFEQPSKMTMSSKLSSMMVVVWLKDGLESKSSARAKPAGGDTPIAAAK
jgi:hypothetical protein